MRHRHPVARLLALAALGICFAASAWAATITGTAKGDVLRGTPAADKISGKAGNDKLYGLAGNDRLDGGTGNDYLDGGPGNDTLLGGPGNDTFVGGAGADRIVCGAGKDTVVADASDKVAKDCETVKRPKPAPKPANVVPGRYCGFTSQGKSICFTITPDRRSFAEGHFGARVDCTPESTYEWTIDFPDKTALKPDGSFEYSVAHVEANSEVAGLVGSYVRGTVDDAGSAEGVMHLSSISFTKTGTSYSCETADATWSAKKQ